MKAQHEPNTEWVVYDNGAMTRLRRTYTNDDIATVDPYHGMGDDGGHTVTVWRWTLRRWHGTAYSGVAPSTVEAQHQVDVLHHVAATGERSPARLVSEHDDGPTEDYGLMPEPTEDHD